MHLAALAIIHGRFALRSMQLTSYALFSIAWVALSLL